MRKADSLDALIGTFTRDRELCEMIAAVQPMEVGRLLVYANWVHAYMTPIQEELHTMASPHFPARHADQAAFWTLTITGGITRDLLLVPYFVVRGAVSEAGFAVRRS